MLTNLSGVTCGLAVAGCIQARATFKMKVARVGADHTDENIHVFPASEGPTRSRALPRCDLDFRVERTKTTEI